MKEEPALSPSIAHILDSESPLHAYMAHRLLGNRARPPTNAQEKGQVFHPLILGAGKDLAIIEAKDFRTNEAKECREVARALGKTPVTRPRYEEALAVTRIIKANITELGISLEGGRAEHRLEWYEDDVKCSGVLDWVSDDWKLIRDLKTSDQSAHPKLCAKRLLDSAGVIQDAAYRHAVEILHPEVMGRVKMEFICIETKDPYAVTPGELSGELREIGEMRWARALRIWKECLATGKWPAYVTGPTRFEAPGWAIAQELEKEEG